MKFFRSFLPFIALLVCSFFNLSSANVLPSSDYNVEEYRRNAELGDAYSQYNLGILYSGGRGVPQYKVEALKWYKKAAEQGLAQAQYNAAIVCQYTMDEAGYVHWMEKAAEQQLPSAQYNLAIYLVSSYNDEVRRYNDEVRRYNDEIKRFDDAQKSPPHGRLNPSSPSIAPIKRAESLYLAAAKQGHKKAQEAYYRLMKDIASDGGVEALNNVGNCYLWGFGVDENENMAIEFFIEASEKGATYADRNLGVCYGDTSSKNYDPQKAVFYFERAAYKEDSVSQLHLGFHYLLGEGVEADLDKARFWYGESATQGNSLAKMMLFLVVLDKWRVELFSTLELWWQHRSSRLLDVLNKYVAHSKNVTSN